jgi:peptide/nickel transport system substrate-binding protein
VAASLSKIGIKVTVNATPKSTFWAENRKLNTSFFLMGWASADGDASSILDAIVHSYDKVKGFGNRGRFSNAEVDALIDQSSAIMNSDERLKYLQKAQKIALTDLQCFIPLHYQVDLYAFGKTINFEPRTDSRIWAFDISAR